MDVVVAGATGHLGSLVAGSLAERGAGVRALVRPGKPADSLQALRRPGVTIVEVDLDRPEALRQACEGAHCVVSALNGLDDVVLEAQGRLLDAAVAGGVRRFIPSDFSIDFTRFEPGTNRNLDLRRAFHQRLDAAAIAPTSIYNGAFMELLGYGASFIDRDKAEVTYWEDPETRSDFTAVPDVAAFTAAAALDPADLPRALHIAGGTASARELAELATATFGRPFSLVRKGGLEELAGLIKHLRTPATEHEVFPGWQGLQYVFNMASGFGMSRPLANEHYPELRWTHLADFMARLG